LSLPVWISYMQHALQNVPIAEPSPPPGVTHDSGDWTYTEFGKGAGVSSLGMDGKSGNNEMPANDEKKRILDLFKN
jgi:penicillin-binding protein 1A